MRVLYKGVPLMTLEEARRLDRDDPEAMDELGATVEALEDLGRLTDDWRELVNEVR